MQPSCIRQTLLPGTTRLFGDYLYDFDKVRQFYGYHFSDPGALAAAARAVEFPEKRRSAIVEALREQNGPSPALDELARPGTVAVVTGQQVGLFSGPAYTIFKALTVARLAEHMKGLGIAAVPIFWIATEDHDLAEVDHAWVFDEHATPAKLSIPSAGVNGGPVGNVAPGSFPIDALRGALGGLPFADDVIACVSRAYAPGATLGSGFRDLLRELLKGTGVLFIDPLAPAVRAIAGEFLTAAAERVPELVSALRERDQELKSAGYHAQVHVDADASLLFFIGEHKRVPFRWKDGQLVARDRGFSVNDLRAKADRLSPNALLRPVMQDYLLPTAAYVAGPAETAYMAQGQVLYEKLLGRMPLIFPRNSFTLLDQHARKLLQRYDLHVLEILDHRDNVQGRIAQRLVPTDLRDEMAQLKTQMEGALGHLQGRLREFDPTLEDAARKSTAKVSYQLDKLSQKTARETMRRNERAEHDAAYLLNSIYPHRRLQERMYSIVPFLAKHGMDLPSRLMGLIQLACPDHMIRTV